MQFRVVTTFPAESTQGARFVETFRKHSSPAIELVVYTDGGVKRPGVFRLEDVAQWRQWTETTTDPLARKFGHKVFALNDAPRDGADWLIWMDADVEFHSRIDFSWLDPRAIVAFLGRPWFQWSECGFVAYNLTQPLASRLLSSMLETYLGHDPITIRWGYDCSTFDRNRMTILRKHQWQDLTGHLDPKAIEQGGLHVWPHSPLASFSSHHKGPNRKKAAYG